MSFYTKKSKDNVRTKSKTVGSDCNYIKSRSKKTKTLQKALSNLCDSDSSSGEDVRPFFLKSWNDTSNKNSSDETSDKTTDKKKSVGSKKEGETNSDKQKAVEKNQKVYSDSKDRGKSEKCAEGKKENSDMSEINKKNTEIESKICLERSDMINGERSLHFKNGALRIFNTFKEMCTKFELKLDHTRSLYSKNLSQQSVKDIIQKSESIVNSIRMELDSKEEELAKLYKEWCDNCNTEITTHKDNSVDEVEALKEAEGSEKLREKPKILDGTLLGSESDEIFSDNDVSVTTDNVEENEEIETATEREILNTADAVSSKTSCDKQDDTLCKKQKEDDGAEISSSNEIVDKDLPEKESNENQGSSDTECETQSEDVNPSSKAKKKRTVSDTILEDDSLNDEDSQKTEEEDEDSGERDEGTKKKAKSLDSSSSESSDSDVIIKTTSTSKRRKKRLPSEEISSSKTRKNSLDKPSTNTGDKLKMRPCVVLKRLSKSMLKKYKRKIRKSLDDLEDKEIRSLVNLDRLQQNVNCKSDSSQTPACKKYKKTSTKHAQDDSKDEENEDSDNLDDNFDSEKDSSIDNAPPAIQTNEELLEEANAAAKRLLLNSSESDIRDPESAIESNDSGDGETEGSGKKVAKKSAKKAKKVETEEDKNDKGNDKWKRNKLLTSKLFSDEDTSEGEWLARQEKLRENEEKNTDSSTANAEDFKPKARVRRRIMKSDSDKDMNNSDSDSNSGNRSDATNGSSNDSTIGKQQKRRKRKPHKSSDTDSSVTDKKSKPKRKRIKNNCSDSSSDDDNGDQMTNSQGTPGKKGRKNIRKVMKDKQVASDTKQAAKEEEERLKRIAERQKLYNEMYEARVAGEQKLDKLVLDFDPETKEDLVTVHENLVKRLKPHQAEGIKFMWDACFESLERIKNSAGSGCIIAHCMGLGKTLQIISLIHTLLTHEQTGVRTVMIACPLSTVLNWMNEFSLWLKGIDDDIEVYEMTKLKRIIDRKYQLERWQRTGGVIVIGYDMFRNLSGQNSKIKKTVRETIAKCLIDPGPDVIVCDEGHILKNEDSALSKSINRVKTMRRIVLTGTPLQNNLVEYHCMVQFVKPSLLGTKKEFSNRFVNPITNGQFDDSTEHDVKVMKKRAYVLHKMLKGCVQRFDYSVLTPILPPKQEYVIFVSLTEVQINMYRYYLENFASPTRNSGGSLFADFQAMQRIWTHPVIVRVNAEKMNEKNSSASDSEGSLRDFVVDDSESSETPSTSDSDSDDDVKHLETKADTKYTRSKADANDSQDETHMETEESEKKDEDWWVQFTKPEDFEDLRVSAKLVLLFGILKECEQIGDKVLVFSQSLYSLNLIENFLQKIDNQDEDGQNSEYLGGHTGCWTLGLDYFRLDGQSSAENRNAWCKLFNKPSNTRARLFLISTRAGGLGINLTAANRVIIFDASWNPSHDVQSIFRIYRFGQKKPCYVYRFLAAATMEEKIYNRQVTKLSLSCRVVDKQQIERHYSNTDLSELYKFEPNVSGDKRTLNVPKDRLLAEILLKYRNYVENYHEHDSLLENKAEEELNDEERKQAWLEYEEEKKGKPAQIPIYPVAGTFPNYAMFNQSNMLSTFNMSPDYEKLKELLQKDYPNATPEAQQMMTARVFTDMYNYWEQQTYHNSTSRLTGQGAVPTTVTMRSQAPIMTQILQNKNVSRQTKDYDTPEIIITSSDDVVEVPTTTVVSKNKNQEE